MFAIVFVTLYIGAIAVTIHSRIKTEPRIERIESPVMQPGERMIMMAELLPPMLFLLVLTVCFIVIRKRRAATLLRMEEEDNPDQVE